MRRWILGIHDACEWLRQGSGGMKTQSGFGQCAMVAPGPRMGGDVVSTFRVVLDGNAMDHGEVPNIFQ